MKEKLIKATHGSNKTPLIIGNLKIPCYVLENGTRVLSGRGMLNALGYNKNVSGTSLEKLINNKELKGYFNPNLNQAIMNRIPFARPGAAGSAVLSYGYEATILIDLCSIILEAEDNNNIPPHLLFLVDKSNIIIRAVAKVGIIALIDEATGYQEIRDKEALQIILDKFLLEEHAKWAKRFPDDFFKNIFKLRNWQWKGMSVPRPSVLGRWINDIVYSRLAPGVLEELRKKNPKDEKGNRKALFQQFLTEDIGHPALQNHLQGVMALQRSASNWGQFMRSVQRSYPKLNENYQSDFEDIIG